MPTLKKIITRKQGLTVVEKIIVIEADDKSIHKHGISGDDLKLTKAEQIALIKERFKASQITEEVEDINQEFNP